MWGFLRFCDSCDVLGLLSIIRSSILLSQLVETHPLQTYAFASRYNWYEVAQATAMRCLDFKLSAPDTNAGLRGVSLKSYSRLLLLAAQRYDRFHELLADPGVFPGSNPDYRCEQCDEPTNDPPGRCIVAQMSLCAAQRAHARR